jgi:hypothetical protein
VASAPSAGATSISVNSATAAFDIPQNAGLFVQLTPQAGGGGVADGDKGDITVSSSGTVWTIDSNVISNAKIRQSAALSVIGRSANSTGDVADITAGTDGHVLRRSGTTLEFGLIQAANIDANAVTTAKILNSNVTLAKIQDISAKTLIGNNATSSATPAEVNKAGIYNMLDIVGSSGRLAVFTGSNSISTDSFITYSSGTLNAKRFSHTGGNQYSNSSVAFGSGAGTSPTIDVIQGSANHLVFIFTSGTSIPSGDTLLFTITLPATVSSVVFSPNNSKDISMLYSLNISTSFQIRTRSPILASTQYSICFIMF